MSGDSAWGGVSLLLHGDGADGGTSIIDSSPAPKLITVAGTVKISTAQYAFGGASIKFDGGANSYLTSPASSMFQMGALDYTLEFWMRPAANSDGGLVFVGRYYTNLSWDAGFGVRRMSDSLLRFYFNTSTTNSSEKFYDCATTLPINANYHVAMSVVSGTGYAFVNGGLVGTLANVGAIPSSTAGLTIGKFPYDSANLSFNGWLDEIRITKGLGRYTASFTPPTAPHPHAPEWWGAVRHGERASARAVATPRKYSGAKPIPRSHTRADNSAGPGSILGTVKVDTLPVTRKVRLFDVGSGQLLKESWSDKAGVYRFDGLALDRPYTVLSHDHQRDYNATVADYVYAEVLP